MIFTGVSLMPLLAWIGVIQQPQRVSMQSQGQVVRRVIIRDQLILKVPVQPQQSSRAGYRLREGPRCVPADAIGGAMLAGKRNIDFVLIDRRRVRVEMDRDCPSLDFYGGFYLQPEDHLICAGRDSIRTRMGGNCQIAKFQMIEPLGD